MDSIHLCIKNMRMSGIDMRATRRSEARRLNVPVVNRRLSEWDCDYVSHNCCDPLLYCSQYMKHIVFISLK